MSKKIDFQTKCPHCGEENDCEITYYHIKQSFNREEEIEIECTSCGKDFDIDNSKIEKIISNLPEEKQNSINKYLNKNKPQKEEKESFVGNLFSKLISCIFWVLGVIFLALVIDSFLFNWTDYDVYSDPLNFDLLFKGTDLKGEIPSFSTKSDIDPELMKKCLEMANADSYKTIREGDIDICGYNSQGELEVEYWQ